MAGQVAAPGPVGIEPVALVRRGTSQDTPAMLTAFDRQGVAEFESPLVGHARQQAVEMIRSRRIDGNPPRCSHGDGEPIAHGP